MKKELKKAIVDYIFENEKSFQLTNNCTDKFSRYIYDQNGQYLIGGEDVRDFLLQAIALLTT